MSGNRLLLEMNQGSNGFEFTSSIESALAYAEDEIYSLDETINSIEGLKPKFTEADYSEYVDIETRMKMRKYEDIIISMSNLLYSISLDEKDRKLLYKSFKKNKKFLESAGISKEEFDQSIVDIACYALKCQKR